MHKRSFLAWSIGSLLTAAAARAQGAFPSRPITIVVPGAPGGGGDFTARLVADDLGRTLGQPAVVDNRPGAGGNIAAAHVARAQPDGHTLLLAYSGTHVANPALFPNLAWDPIKSFTPVALLITAPQVIVVNRQVPAQTLAEFIAHVKANPGKINYASSGTGTLQHIGSELLAHRTGIRMVHVPYKGAGAAMSDLLSGHIQLLITTPPAVVAHIRSGALRPLAIAGKTRHPMLPQVPTSAEAGVKDVELDAWFGLYAPAGTPAPAVAQLADAIEKIVAAEAFRRRAQESGTYATFLGPAALDRLTRDELGHWSGVIRTLGIKAE